jgi:hypothetical protein
MRVVAIEMARARAERFDLLGLDVGDVAARALRLVRHDIGESLAIGRGRRVADEFERDRVARAREFCVGLRRVPDVGNRLPALFAAHEDACLDEAHVGELERVVRGAGREIARGVVGARDGFRAAVAFRIEEGFRQHRADGKIERAFRIVFRRRACGHPHGAELVGVVAEQRRVQVVGQHARVRRELAAARFDQMPVAELFRLAFGEIVHGFRRVRATGEQQRGEKQRPLSRHDPAHRDHALPFNSTGESGGSSQSYSALPTFGFENLFGPSTLSTSAAPFFTQMRCAAGYWPSTSALVSMKPSQSTSGR